MKTKPEISTCQNGCGCHTVAHDCQLKVFARLLLSAYGIHPSDVGVSEIDDDETVQELVARMAEKYALKALPN